jgi:eukaryotic-like serine/threonine-protein kinase
MLATNWTPVFLRRYELLEELGAGGMGVVYRARDRLGDTVALKRLHAGGPRVAAVEVTRTAVAAFAAEPDATATYLSAPAWGAAPLESTSGRDAALRLLLAHEFRALASVRHPNIINVLDYGFDHEGRPYYTMELLEGARTILRAGRERSVERRLVLVEQLLQALTYLHRRGMVHRDLKPANVLVVDGGVDGRVKVLDFGLAVLLDQVREGRSVFAGTPAYMAPEQYLGSPPSRSSDLYAVGVIAYELLVGKQPFATDTLSALRQMVLHAPPDLSGVDPRIAPVIGRLLAKTPEARYHDSVEVIDALGAATLQPLSQETRATRESLLQAAPLVGRRRELGKLNDALDEVLAGQGGRAWLVGGESGVGKSRLLEELRSRALVAGAAVLRGQDVSEGAGPYHAWREILRWLSVLTEPSDAEASVLKALVPEIGALVQREVRDAEVIESNAAHERLARVVEAMLRRLDGAVILFEDAQWARSDSIKLLARVAGLIAEIPVLLVVTYRDDERPTLPEELPDVPVLELGRLAPADIAALSESMIGKAASRPLLIDRLVRETEGNPFFLVEVMRELAEDAGQLDRIDEAQLAASVSSRGIEHVVERRLSRVPEGDRSLLSCAAVLGRHLDARVLTALDPSVALESFLASCSAAAVIDVEEGLYRFAHDKLREGLLRRLGDAERRGLHRRVAEAIEAVHADAPAQTAALAHHWAMAGDRAREAHYCALAGEQALASSAYREAVTFLDRALTLLGPADAVPTAADLGAERAFTAPRRALTGTRGVRPAGSRPLHARLEAGLLEAHGRLGDHMEGFKHGVAALRHLGVPMPSGKAAGVLGILREIAVLGAQSVAPGAFAERAEGVRDTLNVAVRVQTVLSETCYYTEETVPLLWSGLRSLNLGESAGPSPDLARAYVSMGIIAGVLQLPGLANAWCRRAVELAESLCTPYELAWVLQRNSAFRVSAAGWTEVEGGIHRVLEIAERVGDRRQWEEGTSIRALVDGYRGSFTESLDGWRAVYPSARRRDDKQIMLWGAQGQAWMGVRLGRVESAPLMEMRPWVERSGTSSDALLFHGTAALAHFHEGSRAIARESAAAALDRMTRKASVIYHTQHAVAAVAEVFLALWEAGFDEAKQARAACKILRAFAQVHAFSRPAAALHQGLADALGGQPDRARAAWGRAIAEAQRLGMPYEEARAHREIGRHAPAGPERERHLARAAALFERLGAGPDHARTEADRAR